MPKSKELSVSQELAQELALAADADAALERPSISNISLKSGVMTYLDQAVPGNQMDVIVLGWAVERAYYAERYDPDNIVPPNCYALSQDGQNMAPADNVPEPAHPTCKGCKWDEWGSAEGNSRGKRCGEKRRLLVTPASVLDTGMEGAEVAMLKVPVTSLKNWGNYINKVKSALSRPAWSVVTTIKVVPDAKTQFKVLFDLVDAVSDPELIAQLRNAHAESAAYTMQPFDMAPSAEAEPAEDNEKF